MLESNSIIETVLSSITKSPDQIIESDQDTYNETIEKFTNIVDSAEDELVQAVKPKKKTTKNIKSKEV